MVMIKEDGGQRRRRKRSSAETASKGRRSIRAALILLGFLASGKLRLFLLCLGERTANNSNNAKIRDCRRFGGADLMGIDLKKGNYVFLWGISEQLI